MRTSITDPLLIAEIEPAPGYGKVGLTFCPGKKHMGVTGGWDRDLKVDMEAAGNWKAAAVVTLIEEHELEALSVPRLGNAVTFEHMIWHYLPIRDGNVPDAKFEETWAISGAELRSVLREGFNVLVHCKGGLGRAGLVAARLLVELGVNPADAVMAVRKVRPGAIETTRQLEHVMASKSMPEPQPDTSLEATEDRAIGALVGLAIGDAWGTTLEFTTRDSRPRLGGIEGGGPFQLQPGEWTDDTATALALADSLLAHPRLDETDLMERFARWMDEGEYSCTGRCFDIGVTTRTALARFKETRDPFAGSTNPRSAGNGSLMRLAPVAIRHWNDPVTLRDVASRQSRTTHGAPEAVDACVAYAEVLAAAIAGYPRSEVLRGRAQTSHAGAIANIMAGSWRGKHRDAIASTGYVAHSLEAALWCMGRTGNPYDAVCDAVNLADDADTTGAITGQLAGALYGLAAIAPSGLDRLAWGERIIAKAKALFAASLG